MATKQRSMFRETTAHKKPITVTISSEVYRDLTALEERLKQLGGELAFDRARIIEDALKVAIEAGNAELDEQQHAA